MLCYHNLGRVLHFSKQVPTKHQLPSQSPKVVVFGSFIILETRLMQHAPFVEPHICRPRVWVASNGGSQ